MKKMILVLMIVVMFIPIFKKPMSPFRPMVIDRIENRYERGR